MAEVVKREDKDKDETKKEMQQQRETQQEGTQQLAKGGTQLAARREPGSFARDPLRLMRELARDPFQLMRDLLRWDPFREMAPLGMGVERGWSPDFEVRETKDSYVFRADLPGTKMADIEVSVVGNRLRVAGSREDEEETQGDTYFTYERTYGTFTRTFVLPENADTEHIRSELRDGVLAIFVPKKAESQARKIPISSGEKH